MINLNTLKNKKAVIFVLNSFINIFRNIHAGNISKNTSFHLKKNVLLISITFIYKLYFNIVH